MSRSISQDWRRQLEEECLGDSSHLSVRGVDAVENEAEAIALLGIYRALPPSKVGFIYIQPYPVEHARGAVDIFLAHEKTGFLWIEVKGHTVDGVELEGSELFVPYPNGERKHASAQASNRMFKVVNSIKPRKNGAAMNWLLSFPKITSHEWEERGLKASFDFRRVLLKDHINDKQKCLIQLQALAAITRGPIFDEEICRAIKLYYGCSKEIRKGVKSRPGVSAIKLGAYLDQLEGIARAPSNELMKIVSSKVSDSSLLIRGVAGSGKSIALASLCVDYVARNRRPRGSARILVACHNHSLVPFLEKRIESFWNEFQEGAFPRGMLDIQTMSETMQQLGHILGEHFPSQGGPAAQAREYLKRVNQLNDRDRAALFPKMYHAVFIDEAQDFSGEELQLLALLARPDRSPEQKTLVIFYDDAQNINGIIRPTWRDLGIRIDPAHSLVMRECRRSSRQIVELAFNILTGRFANETKRVGTRMFADSAWLQRERLIVEHDDFTEVRFCVFDGPAPEVESFDNQREMLSWVADEVERLIKDDKARPDHICIGFRQDRGYLPLKQEIEQRLVPDHIKAVIHSFSDEHKRKPQFEPGCLTMCSLGRLKGYEAPIVFLIGLEGFETTAKDRAAFYVGATRAKHLLYCCGVHNENGLLPEVQKASRKLRFVGFHRPMSMGLASE